MSRDNRGEMKKILDMVSEGKITPEEGEKLLSALEEKGHEATCPYCAEKITLGVAVCPECKSNLNPVPLNSGPVYNNNAASGKKSFHTVGGLSKTLIIYMMVVSAIVLIFSVGSIGGLSTFPVLLSCLGLFAAILMCKGRKEGWIMGIIWSVAQIILIFTRGFPLNRQFFHIGAQTLTNGDGVGVNIVGIILVVLFILVKKEWLVNENSNYMR